MQSSGLLKNRLHRFRVEPKNKPVPSWKTIHRGLISGYTAPRGNACREKRLTKRASLKDIAADFSLLRLRCSRIHCRRASSYLIVGQQKHGKVEIKMSKNISGAEYPLSKIFSSDFDYVIPSYQRPYAWTVDQASELFDDLYDFYQREKEDDYFLGSIVLIKEEAKPHAEVIDGQQRLATLTILLAAITSMLSGELRTDFENYIREPGRASQGLKPKPRLALRDRDQDFFSKYVQGLQFDLLLILDPAGLDGRIPEKYSVE